MMPCTKPSWAVAALALAVPVASHASDIRVAPVAIDPLPGARTTSLTLSNAEQRPVRVQVRVMKWTSRDGNDVLTPTSDVVASPPFSTLAPQQQYLIRVVRTAKAAPVGEEAYRVLIDEVPEPTRAQPGTVNLVVRQSIPAFFSDIPRRMPDVEWRIDRSGGGAALVGRNKGNRRLRIADLQLIAGSQQLLARSGLVGYVLAGSELRIPLNPGTTLPNGTDLRMRAVSDGGPIEVSLATQPRR
ncbi:molecular chaperone [Sphingomonas sanguinis]|uniref:Molecular chaperone n=1 Tax=Sphingomonas sanguinis TaxID=33051 RepID=A0ABU5LLG1_9SPHN|nr:molecular chaperone [Sphingomonas sanguinis]MDZ7280768.1 molecular chaperone [Sphingomonas sanguinis]